MPRTENDTRTPYARATDRRVTRGLRLVAEMQAELVAVGRALESGNYIYSTAIAASAANLQRTMGELEALEELHEDSEAVAAIARTALPFRAGETVEWDTEGPFPTVVLRLAADSELIGTEVQLQGYVTDPENGHSAQASIIRRRPADQVRRVSVPESD